MIRDLEARRAALGLLGKGRITIAEAATLAGVSRQLAHHWVNTAGLDWRRIRMAVLAREWRRAIGSKRK